MPEALSEAEKNLQRCPIFRKSGEMFKAIRPRLKQEDVPSGTYLYQEDHPGSAMYVIGTGEVTLQKRLGGEMRPLILLKPSDYFGEICALVPGTRLMSAKTLQTSTIFRLSADDFREFRQEHPKLALEFYEKSLGFFVMRYRFVQPIFNQIMSDAFAAGLLKP